MGEQLIISIGREYGSGGHAIGQKLADEYGLPLYDQNLLVELANKKGLSAEDLTEYDEKGKLPFFNHKVHGMSMDPSDNIARLQFNYLKDKAAAGESFVIIGRCAETVLKDNPALVSIFITGDKAAKVERIMKLNEVSAHEAEVICADKDRHRKAYHDSHCELDWGEAKNYDLCINSSKLGFDGTVAMLKNYIDMRRA